MLSVHRVVAKAGVDFHRALSEVIQLCRVEVLALLYAWGHAGLDSDLERRDWHAVHLLGVEQSHSRCVGQTLVVGCSRHRGVSVVFRDIGVQHKLHVGDWALVEACSTNRVCGVCELRAEQGSRWADSTHWARHINVVTGVTLTTNYDAVDITLADRTDGSRL